MDIPRAFNLNVLLDFPPLVWIMMLCQPRLGGCTPDHKSILSLVDGDKIYLLICLEEVLQLRRGGCETVAEIKCTMMKTSTLKILISSSVQLFYEGQGSKRQMTTQSTVIKLQQLVTNSPRHVCWNTSLVHGDITASRKICNSTFR